MWSFCLVGEKMRESKPIGSDKWMRKLIVVSIQCAFYYFDANFMFDVVYANFVEFEALFLGIEHADNQVIVLFGCWENLIKIKRPNVMISWECEALSLWILFLIILTFSFNFMSFRFYKVSDNRVIFRKWTIRSIKWPRKVWSSSVDCFDHSDFYFTEDIEYFVVLISWSTRISGN